MNPQQQNNSKFFIFGIIATLLSIFAVKEYNKRKNQNGWKQPSKD
jgi:hypothetical protein